MTWTPQGLAVIGLVVAVLLLGRLLIGKDEA